MKIIVLIKRKAGTTKEAFKAYYDGTHADLALRYIRPFLLDYRRSYPTSAFSYFDTVEKAAGNAGPAFDYDCVTEMWFKDKSQMDAMFELLATPDVRRAIADDEALFIDSKSVVVLTCEESRSSIHRSAD